jgi:hypothetical protein
VVSRLRFLRPARPAPTDADLQQLVYDLVLARATAMFGPGSSFAVTIRSDDESDRMFSETIAETLAWDVSLRFDAREHRAALTA